MKSQLDSRYGQKRFVRNVDENTFVVYGESSFHRVGEDFFDFQGGPFLMVGMPASMLGIDDDRSIVKVTALECKDEGYAECMVEIG